jgi:hypothetical protein
VPTRVILSDPRTDRRVAPAAQARGTTAVPRR